MDVNENVWMIQLVNSSWIQENIICKRNLRASKQLTLLLLNVSRYLDRWIPPLRDMSLTLASGFDPLIHCGQGNYGPNIFLSVVVNISTAPSSELQNKAIPMSDRRQPSWRNSPGQSAVMSCCKIRPLIWLHTICLPNQTFFFSCLIFEV